MCDEILFSTVENGQKTNKTSKLSYMKRGNEKENYINNKYE